VSIQRNVIAGFAVLIGGRKPVVGRGDLRHARFQALAFCFRQAADQLADRIAFPVGVFGVVAAGVEREDLFEDFQIVRDGKSRANPRG
jgi:hypothetical protein